MLRVALALVGLVVAAAAPLEASSSLHTIPARAFVWANQPYGAFSAGPKLEGKIAYDATPSSELAAMLRPTVGDETSAAPEVTVVVIGEQMLATPNTAATVAGLERMRQGAKAWSSLQQVVSDDATSAPLAQQLAAAATAITHVAGDCALEASALVKSVEGGVEGAVAFVRAAAASQDKIPQLLLVCLPQGDAAAEAVAVESLDAALKQSGKGFMGVYTADPVGARVPSGDAARRHLLAYGYGPAPAPAPAARGNDELFVLQANLLRAFLVVLFTLVALMSGLCCLMSLDTPTRFESVRAEDRR